MASTALRHVGGHLSRAELKHEVSSLYRRMCRSLPYVLNIYDMDMTPSDARSAITAHFRKHSDVKDPRVIKMLLVKGQMELDETLLQYKQRSHLLARLGQEETHVFNPTHSFAQSEVNEMGVRMRRSGLA